MTRAVKRLTRAAAAVALTIAAAGCQQMGADFQRLTQAVAGEDGAALYAEARALDRSGDAAAAVATYRRAYSAGSVEAAYELGEAYETGAGVAQDLEQAAEWYNRAAEGGSPRGQYLVGLAYAEGRGVEQNAETAAAYFARAATQGYAPAQYRLGRAFANGDGVPRDALWAGRWYGKAARKGNADAQFAYGALLAAGDRVPQDLPLGYAYLRLAAENGVTAATELLPGVRSRMGAGQRSRADELIAEIEAGLSETFADAPTVRYVQAALRNLGFDPGPVDGILGPATRDGIRRYQRAQDDEATGELTPDLLRQLLRDTRAAS